MTKWIVKLIFVLSFAAVTSGQEKAVLDKPLVVTTSDYEIVGLSFTRLPTWRFVITYTDTNGQTQMDVHQGETSTNVPSNVAADTFIIALNKANLSTKSLERRLMEHLISEGKIPAATING